MIVEARRPGRTLDVMLRTKVDRVLATGNRVEGVVTSAGDIIRSKVMIDATEYGDVLPLVPGDYRIGKYTGKDVDTNGCVQWITYTAVVKKYANGVPDELRMKNPPPGYAEVRPKFVRQLQASGNPVDRLAPVSWAIHNGYRGLPDSSSPEKLHGPGAEEDHKDGPQLVQRFPRSDFLVRPGDRKKWQLRREVEDAAVALLYIQHDLTEPLWSVAER